MKARTAALPYRESGFESFRVFTNYEYLKDAPLKIAVPVNLFLVTLRDWPGSLPAPLNNQ
jgi:hypothetical protein